MASIKIAQVRASGADLMRKARRLDADKNGVLSPAEMRTGRAKVGDAAVHGINKMKSSMYGNRWYDAFSHDASSPGLLLSGLKRAIDLGVGQLVKIDQYKGSAAAHVKPNKKDGVVKPAEIKNYHANGGQLPHMAAQVLWYDKARRGT